MRLLPLIIAFFSLSTAVLSVCLAADKDSAMQAAKEEAAKLNLKNYISEGGASQVVPEFGSDVSDLTALFEKGQGSLLNPGSQKADGCLSKTSMDCRAVQVIYDTHARPGWPESDFEGMLADRDQLLNKLPELPSNGQMVCETITTTQPPQTDFAVCEESVNASTEACFKGWAEKLDVSTLFECVSRTAQKLQVSCLADYVSSTQQYNCRHAPLQTCSAGEVVNIDSRYTYQCESKNFQQKTYRCNEVLRIDGFEGCELGSMHIAQSETSSYLGQDDCSGGDMIALKYQCSTAKTPLLQIETNVKNSPNFAFSVEAEDFVIEREFSNCKGRWSGKTRCSGTNCSTEIKMEIFIHPGKWDYSGSISQNFFFQKASTEHLVEQWQKTCIADDGTEIKAAP